MTEANVIKKLAKLGTVRTDNEFCVNKTISVTGEKSVITVHTQGGESIIFHVRRLSDVSDSHTDYHAGSYPRNMKAAIERFVELEG